MLITRSHLSWMRRMLLCAVVLLCSQHAIAALAVIPEPPVLKSSSHLLVDINSGKVLSAQNQFEQFSPASLTKMMTMYVVHKEVDSGNLSLTDMVHVSEKAWRAEGSRMFIEVNTEVSVSDLIHGVIIQSGNDASIALAERIAGSEGAFAELMNAYADALGMKASHFVNSTGITDASQLTTAHDMSLLAKAIIQEFPEELFAIHSQKWFTFNGIKQPNRNRLLWRDPSVDGLKTGHTDDAGYCLVATALKDNMRLVSVVMGADSDNARVEQNQRLLNYGFRFFDTHQLYAAGDTLNETRVWMGSVDALALGVPGDIFVTIPSGQYDNLEAAININSTIKAPIAAGESLGDVVIKLNDDILISSQLVALSGVEKGGAWRRFSDYVSMRASQLFHKQ